MNKFLLLGYCFISLTACAADNALNGFFEHGSDSNKKDKNLPNFSQWEEITSIAGYKFHGNVGDILTTESSANGYLFEGRVSYE